MRCASKMAGYLLGAATLATVSCMRTIAPVEPVVRDTTPSTDTAIKSVLDTGWRQTGFRTPGSPTVAQLQVAGGVIATEDSISRIWAFRPTTGWWQVPMPAGYYTRSYRSIQGLGDTFYIAGVARKGVSWNPNSGSMTTWQIPGTPNDPDSSFIQAWGTYHGNLVASLSLITRKYQVCEVWIRRAGQWSQLGKVPIPFIPFDVFYEATDGTLYAGGDEGLYYLGSDSVWTKVPPLPSCTGKYCDIGSIAGITEYDGHGWVVTNGSTAGYFAFQFDFQNRQILGGVNTYRVTDTLYSLYGFGPFHGLLHYKDYLFLFGIDDAPGAWVWNPKRQWFQHIPLLHRGVTYYTSNFANTYGLAVLNDTLYASNSHGVVKYAISDIAADLAHDTLPGIPPKLQ